MADEPINPNPAPATPPATEPTKSEGGIDGLMSSLVKSNSDAPVKPVETLKEGDKVAVQPSADIPPKPEPKDDDDSFWDKAPPKFKNAFQKFKRTQTESVSTLSKKIKDLESKPIQDPVTVEKIKSLEKEREDLRKELGSSKDLLRQSDYQRSDEFKRDHIDKINSAYKFAVQVVSGLEVKFLDGNQDEQKRPATEADFRALLKLEPREQDQKIDEMFGSSAKRVLLHIEKLKDLESKANEAIGNAQKSAEEKAKQSQAELGTRAQAFKDAETVAEQDILKLHPEFFAPDPKTNPDGSKMFSNAQKFFDETVSGGANLTPQQLAERGVAMRYMFSAFPVIKSLLEQEKTKSASLESELAKYRKTDPSEGGGRPSPSGTPAKSKGIDGLFDGVKE